MSSATEEARRRRREKILGNGDNRLKFVVGEKTAIGSEEPRKVKEEEQRVENNGGSSPSEATAPMEDKQPPRADIPRWEQKHVSSASSVTVTRELSEDLLAKLDVTEQMAVEAPKAAADPNVQARVKMLLERRPTRSILKSLKLDSLLSSLLVVYLGYLSGLSNGDFIRDNIWLPLGSIMLFTLFLRIVLSTSLTQLNLLPAKSAADKPGFIVSMIASRIPQVGEVISRISSVSGYFKDSYDDMMLFIFAHGCTAALAVSKEKLLNEETVS